MFAIAHKLKIDIVSKNVGFVKMGGSSNIGYFASDATLDLLIRRQIPMIFVLDSDEKISTEIEGIRGRLGGRANFHTFQRRELEDYLLEPEAVHQLILAKLATAQGQPELPSVSEVKEAIRNSAENLPERVVELRVARQLLKPVFVDRQSGESVMDKFQASIDELLSRKAEFEQAAQSIRDEVNKNWKNDCLDRAPGSDIMVNTMSRFGLNYNKGRDAVRLAEALTPSSVTKEVQTLLQAIASP